MIRHAVSAPTVEDLRKALDDVGSFLERHSLPHVAEVRKAEREVAASDAHGLRRYLALHRALLDVYFSPVNGNARDEREAERLQSELERLHRHAFELANALLRPSR